MLPDRISVAAQALRAQWYDIYKESVSELTLKMLHFQAEEIVTTVVFCSKSGRDCEASCCHIAVPCRASITAAGTALINTSRDRHWQFTALISVPLMFHLCSLVIHFVTRATLDSTWSSCGSLPSGGDKDFYQLLEVPHLTAISPAYKRPPATNPPNSTTIPSLSHLFPPSQSHASVRTRIYPQGYAMAK